MKRPGRHIPVEHEATLLSSQTGPRDSRRGRHFREKTTATPCGIQIAGESAPGRVPTIAVDTHIFRVANRTGLARGSDVLQVETRLLKAVPETFRNNAHHWLILHGRYICKARKPDCPVCPIADLCAYRDKTASTLPANALPSQKKNRRQTSVL